MGPSDDKQFAIHISPFMTREKLDSECRRTIMNLSFAKGLLVKEFLHIHIWVLFFRCTIRVWIRLYEP